MFDAPSDTKAVLLGKETASPRIPPGTATAPPCSALAMDRVPVLTTDASVMSEKDRTTWGLEGAAAI